MSLLYRGVAAAHPAIDDARRGIAVPGDIYGTVTAEDHNVGGAGDRSPFTSWTEKLDIAVFYAGLDGSGGVVLCCPTGAPQPGETWSWEWSPDQYGESEILLRGVRTGLQVIMT